MTDAERTEGEAAAWVVRLHSDQRTQSDQEAFRAWLDADAANVEAFSAHENTALDGQTGSSSPPSLHTPQRSTRFSESSFRSHPTL